MTHYGSEGSFYLKAYFYISIFNSLVSIHESWFLRFPMICHLIVSQVSIDGPVCCLQYAHMYISLYKVNMSIISLRPPHNPGGSHVVKCGLKMISQCYYDFDLVLSHISHTSVVFAHTHHLTDLFTPGCVAPAVVGNIIAFFCHTHTHIILATF